MPNSPNAARFRSVVRGQHRETGDYLAARWFARVGAYDESPVHVTWPAGVEQYRTRRERTEARVLQVLADEDFCLGLVAHRAQRIGACPACGHRRARIVDDAFDLACSSCGHRRRPKVGTTLQGSKIPLRLVVTAAYLSAMRPFGVSSRDLQSLVGGGRDETALKALRLVRLGMNRERSPLDGRVLGDLRVLRLRQHGFALIVLLGLGKGGHVEDVRARTVPLPSGKDLPPYMNEDERVATYSSFTTLRQRRNGRRIHHEWAADLEALIAAPVRAELAKLIDPNVQRLQWVLPPWDCVAGLAFPLASPVFETDARGRTGGPLDFNPMTCSMLTSHANWLKRQPTWRVTRPLTWQLAQTLGGAVRPDTVPLVAGEAAWRLANWRRRPWRRFTALLDAALEPSDPVDVPASG